MIILFKMTTRKDLLLKIINFLFLAFLFLITIFTTFYSTYTFHLSDNKGKESVSKESSFFSLTFFVQICFAFGLSSVFANRNILMLGIL